MKNQIVINGNNIDTLKNYPDNYFDSVVTDPPYGLGKEPNTHEMLKAWIETGYLEVKGSGFMGKEWDAFVPQPIFWKEIYRVLKHGGHVLAFYGTRTYDWGVMAMRLAGFEIRDCIQWIYGSGFPKSHNISKAIDKIYGAERQVVGKSNYSMPKADNSMRENSYGISGGKLANGNTAERVVADITAPTTNEAKEWDGWGSALKPANEPIVLARKPLEKGLSIAENVLKWSTGAININSSRIGDEISDEQTKEYISEDTNGRFPSNVILAHNSDCEMKIEKIIYTDTNEEEKNEVWSCHDDCPIKVLDEQSGESISRIGKERGTEKKGMFANSEFNKVGSEYNDKGGASRFFYVAKSSQWERNYGLEDFEEKQTIGGGGLTAELRNDGSLETSSAGGKFGSIKAKRQNIHPTVKPIKLMQYLVRMITPPNGIVLDPFAGSGTTGIACKIDGFEFVGLELSEEYTEIANARINSFKEEKIFVDETTIYKKRNNDNDSEYQQLSLF
jgi:DNA modification methylase